MASISRLAANGVDWAVLGVFGVTLTGQHVGQAWSSGLNAAIGRSFEAPEPVQSLDELLIVLRRSSGIRFDDNLPGFHLYGTDVVQAAIAAGKGAYAVHAPVIHNSRPCLYLGRDYFQAYQHLTQKWHAQLPVVSCAAPLYAFGPRYVRLRLRHKFNEWRHSRIARHTLDRKHDCADLARRLGYE